MRSSPAAASLALTVAAAAIAGCGGSSSSGNSSSGSNPTAAAASTVQAAGGKVTVAAKEYSFAPSAIAAKAGKLHLTLDNKGAMAHELIVLKTSAAPGSLKVGASGRVSEKSSVGEVSTITAGATKTTTLDLKPGKYTFVCNIPGHYKDGMYGQLTVH